MHELIEKYAKIPPKQRYALIALLAVGMTVGYWYFLHMELADSVEQLQSQYKALEAERAEKQAYVDNLAKYEARLNELQQDLNMARAQLPDAADVPQLLAQLGNKGRQSGLAIEQFQPKGETVEDFVAEITFAVEVKGSYHEIGTFIDAVSKLERIVNVTGISMAKPRVVNKKVVVDAHFLLKTYRFAGQQSGSGG
jgi:type IV pilus assembly protein PilO